MRKSRKKDREKRRRRTRFLLILMCLMGLAPVGWIMMKRQTHWDQDAIQAQLDILPDANARKGRLYEEESQEVGAGDFWVLLNQIPTMEEGSRECNIEYENPEANHYSARVSLYLMETGELLGNTKRVDPGSYVETISLNQELPMGEYQIRAVIELFQEKKPAGNLSVTLSLRVVERSTKSADHSSTAIINNPTWIKQEVSQKQLSENQALQNQASQNQAVINQGSINNTHGNRKEVTGWNTAESGQKV